MLLVRASHSLSAAEDLLRAQNIAFTPFEIAITAPIEVTLPAAGHLVITSSAAVAAIPTGDYKIHCVHEVTAAAVQAAGHDVATVGDNNAMALAQKIASEHAPPALFHHLTTSTANTHWYSVLTAAGHAVQRHSAYSTVYAEVLTAEAIAAVKTGAPVILCSQRGAEHLIYLAKAAKLTSELKQCTAYCLSPAIAEICRADFNATIAAPTPTLTSLLEML